MGAEWLDLPARPRVVFENTPISLVVCQIQFPPLLSIASAASVAPFQEAILQHFPVLHPERNQNLSIQVQGEMGKDPSPPQVSVGTLSQVAWRFTDADDAWTLVLTPESVTLETRAYYHFADFVDRLDFTLKALAKHIRPTLCTRVGLRYINEIRHIDLEWTDVIRPELLGPMAVPQIAEDTQQVVQQLFLRRPDNSGVNIAHGLFPAGTVVNPKEGTQPPTGPFYLLDVDVYKEYKAGELLVKAYPICKIVEDFNRVISRFFQWSITDKYAAALGRRSDVD